MSMNFVSSLDSNATGGRLDEDFGRHFEEEGDYAHRMSIYRLARRVLTTYELTSLRAYELNIVLSHFSTKQGQDIIGVKWFDTMCL
jgi:hypothetical protein